MAQAGFAREAALHTVLYAVLYAALYAVLYAKIARSAHRLLSGADRLTRLAQLRRFVQAFRSGVSHRRYAQAFRIGVTHRRFAQAFRSGVSQSSVASRVSCSRQPRGWKPGGRERGVLQARGAQRWVHVQRRASVDGRHRFRPHERAHHEGVWRGCLQAAHQLVRVLQRRAAARARALSSVMPE